MNTTWCYSGCGWRVYNGDTLVGYVLASSLYGAINLAKDKYGDNVRVEKVSAP